jgi:hypothetical protein
MTERDWYVLFGHPERRRWADAYRYGFVSGGGLPRWNRPMGKLEPADRVFVHVPRDGYTGVGRVIDPAVPVADFVCDDGVPLLDHDLVSPGIRGGAHDPVSGEHVVRVHGEVAVPEGEGFWRKGLFFRRSTNVAELTAEDTKLDVLGGLGSGRPPLRTGARTGDLVRALVDELEGQTVEGTLLIRSSPVVSWWQVCVVGDGSFDFVQPETVEVLEVQPEDGRAPIAQHDESTVMDDLDRGWALGRIPPSPARIATTFEELGELALRLAAPLREAGWKVWGGETDRSWEYGDSFFVEAERGGDRIELELYDHGQLVAYDGHPGDDDGDPKEPFFVVQDVTPEALRRESSNRAGCRSFTRPRGSAAGTSLPCPVRGAHGHREAPRRSPLRRSCRR